MVACVDMHQHMGFAENPRTLAFSLSQLGVSGVCATVMPSEYESLAVAMADIKHVHVGLGLHPWWVSDERCGCAEVEYAEHCIEDIVKMGSERILAEVGLDFSRKWESIPQVHKRQLEAFCGLVHKTRNVSGGPWVYSIHSVKADDAVLDCIEKHQECILDRGDKVILHSFGGSCEHLHRALKLGCYFSVGKRMLAIKRGREYVKAIPAERLLLETDLPASIGECITPEDILRALNETMQIIEEIRGESIADIVYEVSEHILMCAR